MDPEVVLKRIARGASDEDEMAGGEASALKEGG